MDPLELSLRLPGSPPPPELTDVVEMNDVDDDNENEYVPDEDEEEYGDNDDVIPSAVASQPAGSSRGGQRMSSMEDYLDRMFNVDNRYQNQRRTLREQPQVRNLNQRSTVREQPPLISHHLNMEGTNSSMAISSLGEQRRNSLEDYLDQAFNVDNRYQNQRRTVREQPPLTNLNQTRAARQQPPLRNLNQSRTVREQPPVISPHLNMEGTSSAMSEPVAQSAPPQGAMSIFKCPICIEPIVEETVTKCGHIFCGACIRAAIAAKNNCCPLCRSKISLRGLLRIYMPNSN